MRNDDGMALPAVVGLMVVSALLVTAVTAVSLTAVGSASSTRASVQSEASAEAGLAAAQASIMAKAYSCTFASPAGSTPVYSVAVQYGADTGGPSCPAPSGAMTAVAAKTAVLVSTGSATAGGTQGHTAGDVSRLQSVMTIGGGSTTTGPASGSGSGTNNQAVFGDRGVQAQNQLIIKGSAPSAGDGNLYSNADVTCQNSSDVQGRVTSQGNVSLSNSCTYGAVWSAGWVAMSDAAVNGDIFSAYSGTDRPAVSMTNSGQRAKSNVYANGSVSLGDASVSGSVLSTAGTISFRNGSTVSGSAYARKGITYDYGGNGRIQRDAVASRGSVAGPTSQNAGEYTWYVDGNATAAGCIANSVKISGSATPTPKKKQQDCTQTSAEISSTIAFPATPNNPSGVAATAMPSTVPAPARFDFPTLVSRKTGGGDQLDAWTNAGWGVKSVSGCSDALTYLKKLLTSGNPEFDAWKAKPQLVAIRGCSQQFQFDQDNQSLLTGGKLVLQNDLAIMADGGITNQNGFDVASSTAGQVRNLYWLVPSDSPSVTSNCSAGNLNPNDFGSRVTDVRWFFYTPCTFQPRNAFGDSNRVIPGGVYAGSVSVDRMYVQYAGMAVPGLSGGGVDGGSGGGGSQPAPQTWDLTDVRDLSRS